MPTYEYRCDINQDHILQHVRGIADEEPELICTEDSCEGKMVRVFKAPPIEFKGGGFSTNNPWR